MKTIKGILGDKYQDFMEYCTKAEKIYPDEIFPSDYVAFRVQYNVSREYVKEIKNRIICDDNCDYETQEVESIHLGAIENSAGVKSNIEVEDTERVGIQLKVSEQNIYSSITIAEDNVYESDNSDNIEDNEPILVKCEKGSGMIPYDMDMPLHVFLNVENPKKFSDISIEAMGFKSKITQILKAERRESVLDVLECSANQLFDLNRISSGMITYIIEEIKKFVVSDVNSIAIKLRQTDVPFYKLFNVVDIEQYEFVAIESINFNTRLSNALEENEVDTILKLLQLSIDDLKKWKHLGSTSIVDAVIKMQEYFKDSSRKIIIIKNKFLEMQEAKEKVISIIEDEINGKTISICGLTEKELALYTRVKEAINVCGVEFYEGIKNNIHFAKTLSEGFSDYYVPVLAAIEKSNKIIQEYRSIPLEFKNKPAKSLYKAYTLRTRQQIELLDALDERTTLSEFVKAVTNGENTDCFQSLCYFLQWIRNINVSNIVKEIFSRDILAGERNISEELLNKYWTVLEIRAEGETLENIGALTNSTRERIRQIEMKSTKQFAVSYRNNEYDLLAVIHALRVGDNILSKKEVLDIIGEKYANILWLVLSKDLLNCKLYSYSKEYDAVLFNEDSKNSSEKLSLILNKLPGMILDEELNNLVDKYSQEYGVSRGLLSIDIERYYSKFGQFYCRYSPTVVFMCGYILKHKYPSGYKTGDIEEYKRFQKYITETFGDKKGTMTARALDTKVAEVGVLCDRGKYIHPDYLHVDKWIMDEINSYIEKNEKAVVTYSEIFDGLQIILMGSQITNKYVLQGALKHYGCKYKLAKDYITKEIGKSLTDEFEDFARGCGEFHKMDFFAAFPSMTDANLGMLVGRCSNVINIDDGYYIHSSTLSITDKDYNDIRDYLDSICSNSPVNSRYVFDEFSYKFIDFMTKNDIANHKKLFGILNYMFNSEFVFSRPYISKDGNLSLTNRDVILHYLDEYDTITIEDIMVMCQERGIRYLSSGHLIKQVSPSFIRINETTLMRYELTGINDEVILEVANYVKERVEANAYCSVVTISDFLWFQNISVEWTPYLVESIMYLTGDMVGRINIPTSNWANLTNIYVGEEYAEDDYVAFILKILDDALKKELFSSKIEMREFLLERGLIFNNTLPNFLESAEYYYMNEEGILKRR